ncbi:MAG: hypothetical protein PVJ38_06755 [Candidatus Bathyarchaeota archaeon]|jgi:hypothetical protein
MTEVRNIWIWATAALLCTTIAASYLALNYRTENTRLKEDYQAVLEDVEELTVTVDMKLDYGNGTVQWYNATRVPLEADLLKATQLIAEIEYTTGDLGALVNEINGVEGDPNNFWIWHYYDEDTSSWEYGPTGCNAWILHDGDIVAWVYSSF